MKQADIWPYEVDFSSLHILSSFNDELEIKHLLSPSRSETADVNLRDRWGRTALHIAARHGHANVLDVLIESGANVLVTDKWGLTPMQWACLGGHRNAADVLGQHGGVMDASMARLLNVETELSSLHSRKTSETSCLEQQLVQVKMDTDAKLKDAERVLADLLSACDKQRRSADRARERAQEAEVERDQCREALTKCEDGRTDLITQLSLRANELMDLNAKNEYLQHRMRAAEDQLDAYRQVLKEQNQQRVSVDIERIKAIEGDVARYKNLAASSEQRRKQLEEKLKVAELAVETTNKVLVDLKQVITENREQTLQLRAEITMHKSALIECEQLRDRAMEALRTLELRCEDFNVDLPTVPDAVDSCQTLCEDRGSREYLVEGERREMRLEDLLGYLLRQESQIWIRGQPEGPVTTDNASHTTYRREDSNQMPSRREELGLDLSLEKATTNVDFTLTAVTEIKNEANIISEPFQSFLQAHANTLNTTTSNSKSMHLQLENLQWQFYDLYADMTTTREALTDPMSTDYFRELITLLMGKVSQMMSAITSVGEAATYITYLETDLQVSHKLIEALEAAQVQYLENIHVKDKSIEILMNGRMQLEQDLSKVSADLDATQRQYYETASQASYLHSLLKAAEDEIVSLKTWVEASESQCSFLSTQLETVREQSSNKMVVEEDSVVLESCTSLTGSKSSTSTTGTFLQDTEVVQKDVSELFRKIAELTVESNPTPAPKADTRDYSGGQYEEYELLQTHSDSRGPTIKSEVSEVQGIFDNKMGCKSQQNIDGCHERSSSKSSNQNQDVLQQLLWASQAEVDRLLTEKSALEKQNSELQSRITQSKQQAEVKAVVAGDGNGTGYPQPQSTARGPRDKQRHVSKSGNDECSVAVKASLQSVTDDAFSEVMAPTPEECPPDNYIDKPVIDSTSSDTAQVPPMLNEDHAIPEGGGGVTDEVLHISDLRSRLGALEDEIQVLRAELDKSTQVEIELKSVKNSLYEVREEKKSIEYQFKLAVEKFQIEESGFEQRLADMKNVLKLQKERFDTVASALKESEEKCVGMKAKIMKLVRREVEMENMVIQAGLNQKQESAAAPKAAIQLLMNQISELQKRMEKVKAESTETVRAYEERVSKLISDLEAEKAAQLNLKSTLASEREGHARVESNVVNLTVELNDIKNKLTWEVFRERRLRCIMEQHFQIQAVHLEDKLNGREGAEVNVVTELTNGSVEKDALTVMTRKSLRINSDFALCEEEFARKQRLAHEGSMTTSSLRDSSLDWGAGIGREDCQGRKSRLSAEGDGVESV